MNNVDRLGAKNDMPTSLRERLSAGAAARCVALNLTPDQATAVIEMVISGAEQASRQSDLDTPYVVVETIDRHAVDEVFAELRIDNGGNNG